METTPLTYRARWVVPVEGPPIDGGAVTVLGDRIVAIERRPKGTVMDLGDTVLAPGFVNAHAHLDLAPLEGPGDSALSFCDWLRRVVAQRRSSDPAQVAAEADARITELVASGTTLVGDFSADRTSGDRLRARGVGFVVFHEVLGLQPSRYEPLWHSALERVAGRTDPRAAGPIGLEGLGPHAPYSTAAAIYHRAGRRDCPLATHWLESSEEVEFLQTGQGPMRQFLEEIGALDERAGWRPPSNAWDLLAGSQSPWLLVHCNYLDQAIERLSGIRGRSCFRGVVYCPRTHARFGHPPHPWRALRSAGVRVALGTDSLASNPDLRIFDEARFLAACHSGEPMTTWLAMLTIEGARVLGLDAVTGSLVPGKRADLVVLRTSDGALESLLAPETSVLATMVGGRWPASRFEP